MLLDAEIRAGSQGEKNLDDVLRALYERHSGDVGYLPADFRAICSEMAGVDLSEWFVSAVDSTDELDFQNLANWFGLQIGTIVPRSTDSNDADDQQVGDDEDVDNDNLVPWIGIGEQDSPASNAGLSDTDEILAVNGIRLRSDINSRLFDFEIGDQIKLLIAREEQIQEIFLTIGSQPRPVSWSLRAYRQATEDQKERLARWLNQPYKRPAETTDESATEDSNADDSDQ